MLILGVSSVPPAVHVSSSPVGWLLLTMATQHVRGNTQPLPCVKPREAILLNVPSFNVPESRCVKQGAILRVEGRELTWERCGSWSPGPWASEEGGLGILSTAPFRALFCELAGPLLPLAQATSQFAGEPGVCIFKLAVISTPGEKRRQKGSFVLGLSFWAWMPRYPCSSLDFLKWRRMPASPEPDHDHQKFGLVQWEKKKPTKNCVQVSIICGRLKGLSGSRDSTWWNVCILGLSWTVWVTAGVGQKDQTAGTRRRGRSTEGAGIASCALHGGPGQHRGQPVPVRLPEDRATPGPVSHHGWHFSVAADCVCLHTEYVHPEVTGRVSQGRPGWMALWHWLLQVLLPKTASPALEMLPRPGVNQPSFPTSRNELSFYHLTDGEPTFSLIMVRYSRVPEKGT